MVEDIKMFITCSLPSQTTPVSMPTITIMPHVNDMKEKNWNIRTSKYGNNTIKSKYVGSLYNVE